jgi:hypothetical protein
MKEINNRTFLSLVILVTAGCKTAGHQPQTVNLQAAPEAAISAIDIKGSWEEQCKKLDPIKLTKDYPGKKLDILLSLLKKAPESQVNAERERIRRESNEYEQMEEYDRYLLQSLVLISANAKDRAGLVYILSAKCPRFIANSPIELEVASLEIAQPFLILFDSYDKATDGEQRYLLAILRHAFKEFSPKYPDDREFVAASKAWYLENESQIKPNPYYHPFVDFAEQRDLFVSKR